MHNKSSEKILKIFFHVFWVLLWLVVSLFIIALVQIILVFLVCILTGGPKHREVLYILTLATPISFYLGSVFFFMLVLKRVYKIKVVFYNIFIFSFSVLSFFVACFVFELLGKPYYGARFVVDLSAVSSLITLVVIHIAYKQALKVLENRSVKKVSQG